MGDRLIELLTPIKHGLEEHIHLLKEVNKKANMENLDGFWDYQTAAEANEAIVELERLLQTL